MTITDKITITRNDVNKNKHFCRITGNTYSTFHVWRIYVTLGIKSTAGLKSIVEEWNGHNTFVDPLNFDELLQ